MILSWNERITFCNNQPCLLNVPIKNIIKSTHIDTDSLQIQDCKHILSHLFQEESDNGYFLDMSCTGSSSPQLQVPNGNLSYCYCLFNFWNIREHVWITVKHFVWIKHRNCSFIAWSITNLFPKQKFNDKLYLFCWKGHFSLHC